MKKISSAFINGEVKRLRRESIREPSCSPWRAQVVVITDENHKKRLAIDLTHRPQDKPYTTLIEARNNLISSLVSVLWRHKWCILFSEKDGEVCRGKWSRGCLSLPWQHHYLWKGPEGKCMAYTWNTFLKIPNARTFATTLTSVFSPPSVPIFGYVIEDRVPLPRSWSSTALTWASCSTRLNVRE